MNKPLIDEIVRHSGGYPYFIQFLGREVFDILISRGGQRRSIDIHFGAIVRKLDSDFFAGRWAKVTDRQRQLLAVIAQLDHADGEFTVLEILEQTKIMLDKPFSPSHTNQLLVKLINSGLVYKNRHGKYSFAVPLFDRFIDRQQIEGVG